MVLYSFVSDNSVSVLFFKQLPVSPFYKNLNRPKIDKTSKLVTLGQNFDVLF